MVRSVRIDVLEGSAESDRRWPLVPSARIAQPGKTRGKRVREEQIRALAGKHRASESSPRGLFGPRAETKAVGAMYVGTMRH